MSKTFNTSIQKLKDEGVNIKLTPMKKKEWKTRFSGMKESTFIYFKPSGYREP